MDMCGICVMCWICVGYVWCEIRQQSSEEPCDETSFGKKMQTASTNKLRFFSEGNGVFSWQITLGVVGLKKTCI